MSEEVEDVSEESDIQPSVLAMLRESSAAQGEARLAKLLREDRFARERCVQWGVPLGRVDTERLRFRGWQRLFGAHAAGVEDVQWAPTAEAIACLTPGALELFRWPDTAQRHATQLPYSGSRLRWVGGAELLVCSRSSPRLTLVDLHGAEARLSAFGCEALTTLQDVAGTEQGLMYAGARDGSLFVWDRRVSVRCVQTGGGGRAQGSLNCLELSRDGQMLLCGSDAGSLGVWDVRKPTRQPAALYTLSQLGLAGGSSRSIGAMRLEAESGSRVALQLSGDLRCSIFDLASLSASPQLGPVAAGEGERSVASLSFLPCAPWVAATGPRCIRLVHTGRQRNQATLDVRAAVSCLSCHDREGVVFGTRAGELVVFGHPHL
jgi:WD40 repeat protein